MKKLVKIDIEKIKENAPFKLKVYWDRRKQWHQGNKKFFEKNGMLRKKFKSIKRK